MGGEKDLNKVLRELTPKHNIGDYVFCVIDDPASIQLHDVVSISKEEEGYTIILRKETADSINLSYSSVLAWITLTVHSSLDAVGLTAAFSGALSKEGIS